MPAVIERAAVVFRPWRRQAEIAAATHAWTVDASDAAAWTLHSDDAARIPVSPHVNAAIRRLEYLAVQAIFDGPPDVTTAHAALVASDDRGVLIAGIPETGKSTLACALWMRGWSLLGDDVAMIDFDRGAAAPAPRRVSLRSPSRTLLGDELWRRIERAPASEPTDEGYVFHPDEVGGPRPASVRIHAIVFLGRPISDGGGELLRPLVPAHAALALLPCLNLARRLDVVTVLDRLTPLATSVPMYDLRRAELPSMTAALERILAR
jgi:hypothetical protein